MKTGKQIYLSQARANISNTRPIIFWDTCALLDILRLPFRQSIRGAEMLVRYEIIAESIERGVIASVTSSLVITELTNHYNQVYNELTRKENDAKNQMIRLADYMVSTKKKTRLIYAVNLLNIESRLLSVLHRLLKNTIILKEQNVYRNFADYRLRYNMAPAERKAEYKDCYIWGTFVTLIRNINPNTLSLFFTTNTKDYKDDTDNIYPQLVRDCYFPDMKIQFNVDQLYGELHQTLGI